MREVGGETRYSIGNPSYLDILHSDSFVAVARAS
jgi:hypothetical protein